MLIERPLERQQSRQMPAGDPFGGHIVLEVPERIRLTLAAFNHGTELSSALAGLDHAGFDGAQLGLAARASAFSTLKGQYLAGTLSAASAARLICGSSPLDLAVADESLRTSAGPFWSKLSLFATREGEPPVAAPWMAAPLRDELTRHLANGAILLGVGSGSTEQHKSATQILLNHSSHRVHTHDFRH